jgi:hypothetical protein
MDTVTLSSSSSRNRIRNRIVIMALAGWLALPAVAWSQNVVLEWDLIMNDTLIAAATNPLISTRQVALVQGSVFDAVNGIERRFRPLHVRAEAPGQASVRAAAIQAAYAALSKLYPAAQFPALAATLAAKRLASLDAISTGPMAERSRAINAGLAWGQKVADDIFALHDADGFDPIPTPPFLGAEVTGFWRPTAANTVGAGAQFPTMTPWVLIRGSQFRVAPPPALTSAQYAADFNETKDYGEEASAVRTADGTELAKFWAGSTVLYWNRIAAQLAAARGLSLVESAHLLGVLNVTMADAAIACWDSKYRYGLWRPATAIKLADADGNAATVASANWKPLLPVTPAHPENPSGHSTISGAAAAVLETFFGDATPFTVESETRPGVRSFASFADAVAEIANARVFGGIHFRTACVRGNALGRQVASYVMAHAMRARGGDGDDRDR